MDAAFIGMLIAFGATSNDVLAADLVWRATTYLPPIFIGIVTYPIWKRGAAKGRYAKNPDVTPPPGPPVSASAHLPPARGMRTVRGGGR